ncbi:MAG TPA: 30S ribosomal protein S9 [Gammaproteobacteria bacterium]|nr:30S ribosomal protein S9 [Gammaproteobacteria bacterium]
MMSKQAGKKITFVEKSYGTGRRKSSVARAFLSPGKGEITINGKTVDEYFGGAVIHKVNAVEPLKAVGAEGQFDLKITAKSGGIKGQSGAIRLAISRALVAFQIAQQSIQDAVDSAWHSILRKGGFLTRIAAETERKKTGQPKARRKKQFSKR